MRKYAAVFLCILIISPAAPVLAASAPVHACDRLAAHPYDPNRRAEGVVMSALDASKAQAACREAIAAYPGAVRFVYQLGRALYKAGSYGEAAKQYRNAAENNHAGAMFDLGVSYAIGKGVRKDASEAIHWYRRAARKGHADAMFNLGVRYAIGRGVAKDEAQTVRWYRKAAEKGHADAMYNLGVRYAIGRGVAKDEAKTVRWYRKAAEKGHANAMYHLGMRYARGQGVSENFGKATDWIFQSLRQGEERIKQRLLEDFDQSDPSFRRAFQQRLQQAGLHRGAATGRLDAATKQAVEALADSPKAELASSRPARAGKQGGAPSGCGGRPCLQAVGSPGDPPVAILERSRAWAKIVGKIPAGAAEVIPLGEPAVSASIEWMHVEYKGVKGWVPAQFLKAVTDDRRPTTPSHDGTGTDDLGLAPLEDLERLR